MEEVKNLSLEEVLELIKDFPIQPLRNRLIITTNIEDYEEGEVDLSGAPFSPEQYVLAVGSYSSDVISPGQKVHLDLEAMSVRIPNDNNAYEPITTIQLKPVEVDGKVYGMITDDKVEYLINS